LAVEADSPAGLSQTGKFAVWTVMESIVAVVGLAGALVLASLL
jgi:hypothetical protein